MSNRFQPAERRDFLDGGAEIVHFVMRVFLMLAFSLVAGKLHPHF